MLTDSWLTKIRNQKRLEQGGRGIVEQRQFREKSRELATGSPKGIPFDPTQVQPHDQREINKITNVKSPIGKPVRGTQQHHILFRNKFPGLARNVNNAIPLNPSVQSDLHRLNAK